MNAKLKEKKVECKDANAHFDKINISKEKLLPVVHLLSLTHELNPRIREPLTPEELGGIGLLIEDLLEDILFNVECLENIYKETRKSL